MINLVILLAGPIAQTGVRYPNGFNDFLMLAYFVMGAIGIIYVASLVIRQRNLEKDIQLMKQLLEEEDETAVS